MMYIGLGKTGLICMKVISFLNLQSVQKLAAFRQGQNGHKSFGTARICYFRDKFANLIQYARNTVPPKSSKKCVDRDKS